jgi:hypothetical protein
MYFHCFRSKYELQEFLKPSLRIVSHQPSDSGKHAGNASHSDARPTPKAHLWFPAFLPAEHFFPQPSPWSPPWNSLHAPQVPSAGRAWPDLPPARSRPLRVLTGQEHTTNWIWLGDESNGGEMFNE